ncbi:unnamed protein product [Rhizophagus irregularis]|nr:unnamed protein product [Rhizophagus irregularis]
MLLISLHLCTRLRHITHELRIETKSERVPRGTTLIRRSEFTRLEIYILRNGLTYQLNQRIWLMIDSL